MRELILVGLAMLSGSSLEDGDPRYRRPPAGQIDRIERQLAGRDCIGPLNRWERHYLHPGGAGSYVPPDWGVDFSRISFDFREAGVHGFRPGRHLDTHMDQDLDHRQFRTVAGEYEVATDKITIFYCGNNQPTSPEEQERLHRGYGIPAPEPVPG